MTLSVVFQMLRLTALNTMTHRVAFSAKIKIPVMMLVRMTLQNAIMQFATIKNKSTGNKLV